MSFQVKRYSEGIFFNKPIGWAGLSVSAIKTFMPVPAKIGIIDFSVAAACEEVARGYIL